MPSNGSKVLALTEHDLYCPVLTYVFGEATLGGPAAVVSSHRFHSEFYGLKADPDIEIVNIHGVGFKLTVTNSSS